MANQSEVLRALLNKEGAASPADLASELRAGEATIRTYLNRLKKRGYVDGGGSAWYITDTGKAALDRMEEIPITKEDVGEDELSKFRYYGELSGITDDKIEACAELFQNTNMRSMDEMERIMAEMNVPQNQRVQWGNLYRGYLRNTTPPEERDELYPLPKPEEVAPGEEGVRVAELGGRGERLDYIVEDNNVLQVGEGLGMFTFRQALQVVAAKRGTAPQPQGGSGTFKDFADAVSTLNPNKPLTVADILSIITMVNESRGGGGEAPPGSFVDAEGNVQELKPGQPIVVKKVIREPGKTYLLNPETSELEEHEPGKPIIIRVQPSPGSGSNPPAMMPFPVFGGDGQPVYDSEGKPVYANLEPMMRWAGFQGDQRRADERNKAIVATAKTFRENVGDLIAGIKMAAEEKKGGTGAKASESKQEQPQVFECGECHKQFSPPVGWAGQNIKCPNPSCGHEYTKEELLG